MIFKDLLNYIDLETFEKIVKEHGGTGLYIPNLNAFNVFKMSLNLQDDIKTMTASEIANKYGISRRSVKNYLAKIRKGNSND